ncbi:lysophospholipase L1-like esterase [Kitasatospora sp. MAP12-15]|uniref:tachylectin-related carbohydrate-binding protein n=1 Tax=unclassified Kitasatospora TaxID=2633591 RepID=UPI0024762136|nr:tachylectin-related carbohydrate-binding protein [Kitasatospora sp. MAP12-44]MDH6109358.1 lysophospholipase L1-like esterase [Kitasatospora sp. MAP12-44]
MKRLAAVALTVLTATGGALLAPGAASAATSAPPVVRVMPLGDSITAGYQSSTWNGYRGPLYDQVAAQSRYRVNFVGTQQFGSMADPDNEGHSGAVIDQITSGVDGWLTADQPDVVLLDIGANDLNNNVDPTHAGDRLATLVNRIFADRPAVTVIMQGVIPTSPGLQTLAAQYNGQARQLESTEQAAGRHFRFVDAPSLIPVGQPSAEMADGLHPNDAGYVKLAQTFYGAFDQAFSADWFTGGSGAATSPMFGVDGSGNLRYYQYTGDGGSNISWTGTSNNVVSNAPGWGKFTHVFSGGGGVIYGIDGSGNLWYFNYTGDGSSTGDWSATSNSIISNAPGWGKFTQVFSTGGGKIYGVDSSGNLWYYQYTGNGSSNSAWSSTSNSIVSNAPGWGKFTHITGDPTTGAIYGVDGSGNLWYYNYIGDGSSNSAWSSTSNSVISNTPGWGKFNQLFSTGNGEIEGVDSFGNLWYLQYTGNGSSNAAWSAHSNSVISNAPGWNGLAAF